MTPYHNNTSVLFLKHAVFISQRVFKTWTVWKGGKVGGRFSRYFSENNDAVLTFRVFSFSLYFYKYYHSSVSFIACLLHRHTHYMPVNNMWLFSLHVAENKSGWYNCIQHLDFLYIFFLLLQKCKTFRNQFKSTALQTSRGKSLFFSCCQLVSLCMN